MAVKPGDPILKHLTAGWYNRVDAATYPQRNMGGQGGLDSFDHLLITVRNHSTTSKEVYSPVFLDTPHFDYAKTFDVTHQSIVINTRSTPIGSSSLGYNNWAILQEPLSGAIGATAKALMKGISWLQFPTVDLGPELVPDYLLYEASSDLIYSYEGEVEILFKTVADTQTYFLVVIGNRPIQRHRFFVLAGNMAAYTHTNPRITSRALANFYDVDGNALPQDYLYSWDGIIDDRQTGFEGVAVLMDNTWIFDQATCQQGIISS